MNHLDTPDPDRQQGQALLVLLLVTTVLFAIVLWPLAGAVAWAVFMAIVFAPLQRRSLRVCGGRAGWAAASTLMVIVVSVLLPLGLLTATISQEASVLYEKVRSGQIQLGDYVQHALDALPTWLRRLLDRFGMAELSVLQQKLVAGLSRSGQVITTQALSIGQDTLDFVISLFVMLYVLFFLLRDGEKLASRIAAALPLRPDHRQRLLAKATTVVRATVKGNVLVALVQGALGALAFWVLGVPGPMLWGTLMAILSLLPAVGAALVWLPVAVYFLLAGSLWPALGLFAWGVLVIGLIDNLLRPVLVGKEARIPDYMVLVTTLGGLAVFGLSGFVIGPVIAALFIAVWDIFSAVRAEDGRKRPAPPAPGQDTM